VTANKLVEPNDCFQITAVQNDTYLVRYFEDSLQEEERHATFGELRSFPEKVPRNSKRRWRIAHKAATYVYKFVTVFACKNLRDT
jgi:hypothetical protein